MELEIAEIVELLAELALSFDVDGVAAFRPGGGAGSETLPVTSFFLQIFPRSLSSSSVRGQSVRFAADRRRLNTFS